MLTKIFLGVSLLALAGRAFAEPVEDVALEERGHGYHHGTKTTYTTITLCPVTSTYTEKGK